MSESLDRRGGSGHCFELPALCALLGAYLAAFAAAHCTHSFWMSALIGFAGPAAFVAAVLAFVWISELVSRARQ